MIPIVPEKLTWHVAWRELPSITPLQPMTKNTGTNTVFPSKQPTNEAQIQTSPKQTNQPAYKYIETKWPRKQMKSKLVRVLESIV